MDFTIIKQTSLARSVSEDTHLSSDKTDNSFGKNSQQMYVVKRSGEKEEVRFDKITERIKKLCYGLDPKFIDPIEIAKKVIERLYPGVTTTELDNQSAEIANYSISKHPDYGTLASRLAVSNLHRNTYKSFSEVVQLLYNYRHPKSGKHQPKVSKELYEIVCMDEERTRLINKTIVHDRDYFIQYFGLKTLERSYLKRYGKTIVERPQHLYMRVAIGIHGEDLESAFETYNFLSQKYFVHATPTLFNAGTPRPQMSSCYLLQIAEDSIHGIYKTLKSCAHISKYAGGIGVSIHKVRANESHVAGTDGMSDGICPMLKVFDRTAVYVNQGSRRKGSFAFYLEPWHADVFDFLDLKKPTGSEEHRARNLFYALWIPDLFMKRVEQNGEWSLFCPNEIRTVINPDLDPDEEIDAMKSLSDFYGKEFEDLYVKCEELGLARKKIKAQELWFKILERQIENGVPYMLFKDACNIKSNQKNLGTIQSSNLCTEIIEYTAEDEIAVCNLASQCLPMYVDLEKIFDHEKLGQTTRVVVRNLNKIIDKNFYPVKECENSNFRHRPVGIGVQGLADTFALLRMPFASPEAKKLNCDIFETIYYYSLLESCELAKKYGAYKTFSGSPASKGILQYDMWNIKPDHTKYDWESLKENIKKYGLRNSLLLAPMPTASTSNIMGNNECIEPFTSNIYTRRVLSGEFIIVNKHLMNDLIKLGIWNEDLKNIIISKRGSVQGIDIIPKHIQELYKTSWEIKQKDIIDMAADRGAFICQSQSLNIHMADPTPSKLTSMHFYAWKKGLKTGMYYLRTKSKSQATNFAISKDELEKSEQNLLKLMKEKELEKIKQEKDKTYKLENEDNSSIAEKHEPHKDLSEESDKYYSVEEEDDIDSDIDSDEEDRDSLQKILLDFNLRENTVTKNETQKVEEDDYYSDDSECLTCGA